MTLLAVPMSLRAQVVNTPDEEVTLEERDNYQYISHDVGAPTVLHLRTNLLYDAVLLPNVGAELSLGRSWTFLAEGTFNWLSSNSSHRYWRVGMGAVEARYWFGGPIDAARYLGHHMGIYVAGYRYDIEFGGDGQMADFNYGAGLSYGYSTRIGRKLSLDFGLALGYIGGKYKKYEPVDDHYVWKDDFSRTYFGPTKAEVTLVWHIELTKKGGFAW